MKKLALTSLLAVFAISGAHAANVIDGNPLYMPKAGHFYSETSLASHSENTDSWMLAEEFGYGITDNFAVEVGITLPEYENFDVYGWQDLSLNAIFRAIDEGGWKADLYAGYQAGSVGLPAGEGLGMMIAATEDDTYWFDKDIIHYTWTAGIRGGYVGYGWTVAGHFAYNYFNTESFNWGDEGFHQLQLGLDAQLVLDANWNLVAGVEYTGYTDDEVRNGGSWDGMFGVNYNINPSAFVGAYVGVTMDHWKGDIGKEDAEKGWGFEDGFGFGMKFGIDF